MSAFLLAPTPLPHPSGAPLRRRRGDDATSAAPAAPPAPPAPPAPAAAAEAVAPARGGVFLLPSPIASSGRGPAPAPAPAPAPCQPPAAPPTPAYAPAPRPAAAPGADASAAARAADDGRGVETPSRAKLVELSRGLCRPPPLSCTGGGHRVQSLAGCHLRLLPFGNPPELGTRPAFASPQVPVNPTRAFLHPSPSRTAWHPHARSAVDSAATSFCLCCPPFAAGYGVRRRARRRSAAVPLLPSSPPPFVPFPPSPWQVVTTADLLPPSLVSSPCAPATRHSPCPSCG